MKCGRSTSRASSSKNKYEKFEACRHFLKFIAVAESNCSLFTARLHRQQMSPCKNNIVRALIMCKNPPEHRPCRQYEDNIHTPIIFSGVLCISLVGCEPDNILLTTLCAGTQTWSRGSVEPSSRGAESSYLQRCEKRRRAWRNETVM